MNKISFLGDLMFERPYIKSKKQKDGTYDFSGLLTNLYPILKQSDLVVANLETVFAGKKNKYTKNLYSFNTPDEAVYTLKDCKVSLVTTANNHCLDRGIQGLKRTIEVLRNNDINCTGTYLNANENKRSFIKEIDGVRYAFMSYTYGTNTLENKLVLDDNDIGHVNLLKPQEKDILKRDGKNQTALVRILTACTQKLFSSEIRMLLKKILGMPLNVPIVDDNINIDFDFIKLLSSDITKTKRHSDVIFMCLHSGGQFNSYPGKFTKEIVEFLHKEGIKYIVATHPHVVQLYKTDKYGNITFYSIGNLTISSSSAYVLHELKPEYSIIPHFYFEKNKIQNVYLKRLTFSITKVVEDKNHSLIVYPIKQLGKLLHGEEKKELLKDVTYIYGRVLNTTVASVDLQDEYEIKLA